ncbi:MAG: TerB family tellurite resistance protein [Xanthomonadales bacterium]|nr:TerB family tellurite resistance protein [Xanthomonadales bacterium]
MKSWLATVLATGVGALIGGPYGAVVGLGVGQAWDRGWIGTRRMPRLKVGAELSALFELLGHLARADGRVSEREVAFAEGLMDRFELRGAQRARAVEAFDRGRAEQFRIDAAIEQLAGSYPRGSEEARQLADLLLRLAETDGPLVPAERGALARISERLGLTHAAPRSTSGTRWTDDAARRELGLERGADGDTIRAAYKRLLSKYHPDKLAARGLSEAEQADAQARLQRAREAYEHLRPRGS